MIILKSFNSVLNIDFGRRKVRPLFVRLSLSGCVVRTYWKNKYSYTAHRRTKVLNMEEGCVCVCVAGGGGGQEDNDEISHARVHRTKLGIL